MSLWDELLEVAFDIAFRLLGCVSVIVLLLFSLAMLVAFGAGVVAAFMYLT